MGKKINKYVQLIFTILLVVLAAWNHNITAVMLAAVSILLTVRYNV
ncbi:hypothetical protein LKI_09630 [Leuconostoc kimchii IMSNU 11154]|uniref:Uncharacterized protein n=1 Tax=Leuconostoc kimchii (strain IMSNU 11154 / KCTC 2386 / IH25) TaxID=762051 RepID=D5T4J4_LEUKI|nr:hypothetical protein [Leuconostoc kimchii]ADG41465.1 hypothetical protein LKI_09630 [Leuconostoc kimchii IMSNU 11154]